MNRHTFITHGLFVSIGVAPFLTSSHPPLSLKGLPFMFGSLVFCSPLFSFIFPRLPSSTSHSPSYPYLSSLDLGMTCEKWWMVVETVNTISPTHKWQPSLSNHRYFISPTTSQTLFGSVCRFTRWNERKTSLLQMIWLLGYVCVCTCTYLCVCGCVGMCGEIISNGNTILWPMR